MPAVGGIMRFLPEVDTFPSNLIHLDIISLIPLFSACRERLIDVGTQLDILSALRGEGREDECHTVAENPSSVAAMKWQNASVPISHTEFQTTCREQGTLIIIIIHR